MTSQPKWKCIAQLGDMHPIDHGGIWVMIDKTGENDPMIELLEVHDLDNDTVERDYAITCIDRCTYIDGILSDNQWHPALPAWFAKDIDKVSSCMGRETRDLIDLLCSADPIDRARGYRDLISYYGIDNFGGYDMTQLTRGEAKKKFSLARYRID